ncbi:MAG TPA: hypothetical protein VLR26_11725 [Frankiaceae bacterium]|nr:hypothetical protein [Frankiaceae bacterium]
MNKVVVPIVALAAVGLAGCGSSPGTKAAPSGSSGASSASAAAGLNGEQSKPAQQVLSDAKSALFNAQAVHVKGTMTKQGQTETLDVQFQGEDTAGTVQDAGVTLNIVKTGGKLYVKAPEQFWAKTVGPAAAPKLANKWLVQDASMAGNVSSLTLQGIAASLNAADSPLKPGVTTGSVDGQKAVLVTQQDGSQLAVANTGAPLPLQVTENGPSKGSLNFTGYGQPQPITAPPGAVSPQQAAKAPTTGSA